MRYGDYQVIRPLQEGGMGQVLLARGKNSELVVIKRMRDRCVDLAEYASMFRNETRLLARLSHPNIPRLLDSGQHEGTYYLVMEHIHGADLSEVVKHAEHRLTPALVAYITESVAAALDHAHTLVDEQGDALNVVHRDISPHNVRIGHDGRVMVIDFGVAKVSTQTHVTAAGVAKGKFPYMSPEQLAGAAVDSLTDIFALGIVMHEMLTYLPLFASDDPARTISAIQTARIPRPSELTGVAVPAVLEAIAMKALQRDPARRHASAALMQQELRAYLHQDPVDSDDLAHHMTRLFGDPSTHLAEVLDTRAKSAPPPADAEVLLSAELFDAADDDEADHEDEDATVPGRPMLPGNTK